MGEAKIASTKSGEAYECQFPWPADCYVQAGGNGIVFTEERMEDVFTDIDLAESVVALSLAPDSEPAQRAPTHYRTAFFEAFPRSPDTFIRGEGKTMAEAEVEAWQKYEKVMACPGHEFEARGYTNGAGFCKHCNMFASGVIPPVRL